MFENICIRTVFDLISVFLFNGWVLLKLWWEWYSCNRAVVLPKYILAKRLQRMEILPATKRGGEWSFKNSGSRKILVEFHGSSSLVF